MKWKWRKVIAPHSAMFTFAPVNYKGNMDTDLSPASVSANSEQVSLVIANPWGRLTHYEHRDAQGSVAGTHHRRTSFCLEVSHALMSHRFPHFSPSAEAGVSAPQPRNSNRMSQPSLHYAARISISWNQMVTYSSGVCFPVSSNPKPTHTEKETTANVIVFPA